MSLKGSLILHDLYIPHEQFSFPFLTSATGKPASLRAPGYVIHSTLVPQQLLLFPISCIPQVDDTIIATASYPCAIGAPLDTTERRLLSLLGPLEAVGSHL